MSTTKQLKLFLRKTDYKFCDLITPWLAKLQFLINGQIPKVHIHIDKKNL